MSSKVYSRTLGITRIFFCFSLILAYCEANEQICKDLGINLSTQEGSNDTLLGEDDISILEAMLITLGVIVGIGGLLGILLLCCLRRRLVYIKNLVRMA